MIAIYGTGGIGKTSLAAEFPKPIYLYTEGEEPPTDVEMMSAKIESLDDLFSIFGELLTEEHEFQTVIIDAVDSLEKLVWEYTCARMGGAAAGWDSIDSNDKGKPTAFGKGYLAADYDWNEYIAAINALARHGMHVVQIIHSEAKKWDDPIVDSYMQYKPNLQERAMKLVMNKSHALLFMNKRASIKQIDKGFGKKESKPEGMSGAERTIFTDGRAGFLAKNRLNMPATLTYKKGKGFEALAQYFYNAPTPEDDQDHDVAEAA